MGYKKTRSEFTPGPGKTNETNSYGITNTNKVFMDYHNVVIGGISFGLLCFILHFSSLSLLFQMFSILYCLSYKLFSCLCDSQYFLIYSFVPLFFP